MYKCAKLIDLNRKDPATWVCSTLYLHKSASNESRTSVPKFLLSLVEEPEPDGVLNCSVGGYQLHLGEQFSGLLIALFSSISSPIYLYTPSLQVLPYATPVVLSRHCGRNDRLRCQSWTGREKDSSYAKLSGSTRVAEIHTALIKELFRLLEPHPDRCEFMYRFFCLFTFFVSKLVQNAEEIS